MTRFSPVMSLDVQLGLFPQSAENLNWFNDDYQETDLKVFFGKDHLLLVLFNIAVNHLKCTLLKWRAVAAC